MTAPRRSGDLASIAPLPGAAHRDEIGWSEIYPWIDGEGVHFEVQETDRAFRVYENTYTLSFTAVRPFVALERLAAYDVLVAEVKRVAGAQPDFDAE